jgi:hypothetical protein
MLNFIHSRDALRSFSRVLGNALPIKQKFFDNLYALDNLELNGSLLLDFSVKAGISRDQVSGSTYGGIALSVVVNRFEATASFGSVSPFSLNLPLELPGASPAVNFTLTDASFGVDITIKNPDPINIIDLFSGDQASTALRYGGSLLANLPMTVGIADTNIGIELTVSDENLFESNVVGKWSKLGLQSLIS